MVDVLDGRAVAAEIRSEVAKAVEALGRQGVEVGLAAVRVGSEPGAGAYLRTQAKVAEAVGIRHTTVALPEDAPQEAVRRRIEALNRDADWHGVLLATPLPDHLDGGQLAEALDPRKDVDGFHPWNLGRLLAGRPALMPATPRAVQELLLRTGYAPAGRDVTIVGRSDIVGKPLAALLAQKDGGGNATVTLCHSRTRDVAAHTRRSDVVVVAVGRPGFLTAAMVRPGAVVVDVGINVVEDPEGGSRVVGDVAYEEVAEVAGAITPVPGGVGPVTVSLLMANAAAAARTQARETF